MYDSYFLFELKWILVYGKRIWNRIDRCKYITESLYCMKVKLLVAQLCLTLCDPVDCSPPGSSVHGIAQARILEWVAISFSRGSSQLRN